MRASILQVEALFCTRSKTISIKHERNVTMPRKNNKKIGRHVSVGLFCRESICAYLMRSGRLFCRRNQNAMFIKKNSQRPFAV